MKVKILFPLMLTVLVLKAGAQNTVDIINYISTYKDIAISEMQRSGIPASIILAQGIHETEAGTSELVRKSNNHFGIKCKDTWTGSVVYHDDDERGECFRSYQSPADSYKDHSDFLRASSRYAFLFKIDPTDYTSWAYGLKKAGYATNVKYPQILIRLIDDYNLQQYTMIAMGKMDPQQEKISNDEASRAPVTNAIAMASSKKNDVSVAAPQYPVGDFELNRTKVTFARAGTSLLVIADHYNISLSRLLDFNDLKQQDVLSTDQLIFLQRKRKTGNNEFHIVQDGETIYSICQAEGIRMESIRDLNDLPGNLEPAAGEKLYLQDRAPTRPALASEKTQRQELAYHAQPAPKSGNVQPAVSHVVQPKETLYSIAKRYSVTTDQIIQWNRLDASGLKVGQELIIYKN